MYYALVGVVCFVLGLVLQRFVLAEASSIKTHITNEIAKLRQDLGIAVSNVGTKIGK
jgi:hypothetical protein